MFKNIFNGQINPPHAVPTSLWETLPTIHWYFCASINYTLTQLDYALHIIHSKTTNIIGKSNSHGAC